MTLETFVNELTRLDLQGDAEGVVKFAYSQPSKLLDKFMKECTYEQWLTVDAIFTWAARVCDQDLRERLQAEACERRLSQAHPSGGNSDIGPTSSEAPNRTA